MWRKAKDFCVIKVGIGKTRMEKYEKCKKNKKRKIKTP